MLSADEAHGQNEEVPASLADSYVMCFGLCWMSIINFHVDGTITWKTVNPLWVQFIWCNLLCLLPLMLTLIWVLWSNLVLTSEPYPIWCRSMLPALILPSSLLLLLFGFSMIWLLGNGKLLVTSTCYAAASYLQIKILLGICEESSFTYLSFCRYDKGSWLVPVSLIPLLGPSLYLLLRPSLTSVTVSSSPTSSE